MTDSAVGNAPVGPAAERMSGGDAIVTGLLAHGVDTVFNIPGVQAYVLFDSLERA